MLTLSDLPTERAIKELGRVKGNSPAITKVIETMALYKQDLVKSMRLIEIRERILNKKLESLERSDKTIRDWLKDNPGYDVDLHAKE